MNFFFKQSWVSNKDSDNGYRPPSLSRVRPRATLCKIWLLHVTAP